ncbi:Cullin-4B [Guyanagaster necrorhizus]|uniref:Cullin-4B n=1 Tax=Guyanagaster necrorhizus TaxID=856835 RepID=A0A9P8AT53_9AGAR|nr:Cullin-4B [Guyanagaster necrorhizus MCA 3950]KAG7447049.1 Cullin-4B [Guyanagaster necrorhizus MCA 3950]
MTSILSLLSLPTSATAFTDVESNISDDGSASPLRKVPRLDSDSDISSAARSKSAGRSGGVVNISIIGDHIKTSNMEQYYQSIAKRTPRFLFTRESIASLPSTYEQVFNSCRYVVSVAKDGATLYTVLKLEIQQCVEKLARELTSSKEEGVQWLPKFVEICEWYETQVATLQSLFSFLDQIYVAKQKGLQDIGSHAYSSFNSHVFGNIGIAERLRSGIALWAEHERKTNSQHALRECIPKLMTHIATFGQYSAFEQFYIDMTREQYCREVQDLIGTFGGHPDAEKFYINITGGQYSKQVQDLIDRGIKPTEYFEHVRKRIQEENARSADVLPPQSWNAVRISTEKALLDGNVDWLALGTLRSYMEARDFKSLSDLYKLYVRVGGEKVLCAVFRGYTQTSISDIVTDKARDDEMVHRLLELRELANIAISTSFCDEDYMGAASTSAPPPTKGNQEFVYALSDAFTHGFKARRNKPAEMIATYLDKLMRRGQGASSEDSHTAALDAALALYRFTEDKDVFRTFYHRQLAKRLLLGRSASDDVEKRMLKKLQDDYDPEFGQAEKMFKDLALSGDLVQEFRRKHGQDELYVNVLERGGWPFSLQRTRIDLPAEMQEQLNMFTKFYDQKHQGRKLVWDHALSTVILKTHFEAGSKDLSLSLYQTIIVLLFTDVDEVSFTDIKAQTRMDDAELRLTLQSLACGKKKVLLKVPPGKDIMDWDKFRFNVGFTDPRQKIHINSIQAKVSEQESQYTQTAIESDRKSTLDAAIVRIMKGRKELAYEKLKVAVIEAVKGHFMPPVDLIKKRVDWCVENEYLERDEKDKSLFRYVA